MRLGPTELLIILAVILVLFGGRKLPELAKGLGQGLKEFKLATREGESAGADDKTPERKEA
jgi:sec-independent protein translocase protein TatA